MVSQRLFVHRAFTGLTAAFFVAGAGCSSSPERQDDAPFEAASASTEAVAPICVQASLLDSPEASSEPPPGDPFDSLNVDALGTRSVWEERFPRLFQSESNETSGLGCMASEEEPASGFVAHDLPGGAVLGQILCAAGAYNFGYAYFLIDQTDDGYAWTRVSFPPCSSNDRASRRDLVFNPVFDGASGNLTSFIKGRGLGDCGTSSDFYYQTDSASFCMRHCSDKPDCDGRIDNWPETETDDQCRVDSAFEGFVAGEDANASQDDAHEGESAEGHHHGAAHHRFSDPSDYAERWNSEERLAWQKPELLVQLMELQEGMRVADIGAGTGFILPYLSDAVGPTGRIAAIDIEESMLHYVSSEVSTRLTTALELCHAEPSAAPLLPSSVDRVITINTWHHVQDRVSYARDMRAAFRDGGAFFIVDYTMEHSDGPPMDMRILPEDVISELVEAGYEATQVPADLPRQYIIRAVPR